MEVTIEITDYCPHNCDYCSTDAGTPGRHLDFEEIRKFLNQVQVEHGTIKRINISGGEPLAHPKFYNILRLCEGYTLNVWIYTNAIRQIMYNAAVVRDLKVEANVCLVPGRSAYIPENADKVHLLQLIPQGRAKNMKPANFHVSSNISNPEKCKDCKHTLLQANRKIVKAPCKKEY